MEFSRRRFGAAALAFASSACITTDTTITIEVDATQDLRTSRGQVDVVAVAEPSKAVVFIASRAVDHATSFPLEFEIPNPLALESESLNVSVRWTSPPPEACVRARAFVRSTPGDALFDAHLLVLAPVEEAPCSFTE